MFQIDAFDENGITHAFFSRRGGVSRGIYTSLNCGRGSGDDPKAVEANRARAASALDMPPGTLFTNHQIHSNKVAVIDEGGEPDDKREADALVTNRPGIVIGVLAADCAPVLFSAPGDRVIGAAHAGWRGALDGVCDATVDAMIDFGVRADGIKAAVGPCIGMESYEVGPEFPGPFLEQDEENGRYFEQAQRDGHFLFDLSGYLVRRLSRLGLGEVLRLGADTCRDEANFFSYRRSRHRSEPDYGRQLAAITLGA
ncbi:MAG: peptidoglycan editing factor PgeF [Thalassobaculaceae bacterium]|nr:peptidoglycan editing factor PgeF [Thalassobaculaceae bacterium]